jgi:hypothetical protein
LEGQGASFQDGRESSTKRKALDMDDIWTRIASDMADRVSGPMKFRLVMQPAMAAVYAIIAGLKDAKAGKPPYLWALASNPAHRVDMMKDGWKGVGKVFLLAVILDIVYQLIVIKFIYPGEAIIVAFVLAIFPYLILRGLVTRLARRNGPATGEPLLK